MKRLFAALVPPHEVKDALVQAQQRITFPDARLVLKEDMHVTVFFLGEVQERHLPAVEEKLAYIARKTKPFFLRCERIGYAPPGQVPTMLWAVFRKSAEYAELAERARTALNPFAARDKIKEPVPHITLARFEAGEKITASPFKEIAAEFQVDSVVLMESQGGPNGSRYTILRTFLFSS